MPLSALWPGGPLFDPGGGVPLGMDSLLLADFAKAPRGRSLELCCGSGAVSLLLLSRIPALEADCIELLSGPAEDAARNFAANGLERRARVINGDIRAHRKVVEPGAYALCVCNPPYFPAGSGSPPSDPVRAVARSEMECTLSDVLDAAAWALKNGGALDIVHRPERLAELLAEMRSRALEPKRLRLVQRTAESAPSLILAEGRRGAAPGLKIEPPLIICSPDGGESGEYRRICHRGDG